ncbi:MAG: ATP-dependent RNA helicase DbpA [Pseudomonadales bacterium]|nr:ATP-dependent RNA helicase DbpA [Pseudomonadales bacterium]
MHQPFSSLSLSPNLLENLDTLKYVEMTEIQAKSLPEILSGKDVIAQAKTGSGKTAAFGLGVLEKLDTKRLQVQSLVLCPTRELADQVSKELRRLARRIENVKIVTLCGGISIGPQIGSLEYGAHIVVGTPGRILKHLGKKTLKLDQLKTLVLDEADRMLDMGFSEEISLIIEGLPTKRQTLLFSATYPNTIQAIANQYLYKPVRVTGDTTHGSSTIQEYFFEIEKTKRKQGLSALLKHYRPESTLIFCNTKKECQSIAEYLQQEGLSALAIHGDLKQQERDQVLLRFSNRSCSVLVATDVAARGLDVKELNAVINYEITRDAETHIHRIGRTGRNGNTGLALNLFTVNERYRIAAIEVYRDADSVIKKISDLDLSSALTFEPAMITLQIDGGRKQKVRPGDILGALTGDAGLKGDDVGKIDITSMHAFVAVKREVADQALTRLKRGKIKGRTFKVRELIGY